ncbi:serine hydroxymethyltransferase [Candidatus Saccharibacteria bacterium]|nr:serine hydroxymethyltransferase [Candidatus Saccharibacteria bacterium]
MFSLIAAIGKNRELGKNGKLLFHAKEDMRFFREKTINHKILMGRKTWESLPGKLKNRENIVVSRHEVKGADQSITNLSDFIDQNKDTDEEIFVIGGGMLYFELLPYAKTLYLTEFDASNPSADTFFPAFNSSSYKKTIIKQGFEDNLHFSINRYENKLLAQPERINMKDLIFNLIEKEKTRQSEGLELIPSENYVSKDILKAMGSVLTNKYSEGYPSFEGLNEWSAEEISEKILPNYRYYGGQVNVDRIERLAISLACKLFHADHANVQPHSGANANEAVYFAWCEPGDNILAMNLGHGGHLTHGSPVTRSAHIYNFIPYGTTEDGDLNYNEIEKLALENDIKLILVGYSAFMKIPDFKRVSLIRQKAETKWGHEILLMADMAHVAGLIAAGIHPNPLDFDFNVMTTTTHKTLRGPRGGLILSKGKVSSPLKKVKEKVLANIPTLIDKAVFPGTQGGPLEHIIAAKAICFAEAMSEDFRNYASQTVINAKALAKSLQKNGFYLQGGGTENHLILINIKKSYNISGKFYEKALDLIGLTLNANALPGDTGGAFNPDGVRLGTPAITTRGLKEPEMQKIADWMKEIAILCQKAETLSVLTTDYAKEISQLRDEVKSLAKDFPIPSI